MSLTDCKEDRGRHRRACQLAITDLAHQKVLVRLHLNDIKRSQDEIRELMLLDQVPPLDVVTRLWKVETSARMLTDAAELATEKYEHQSDLDAYMENEDDHCD